MSTTTVSNPLHPNQCETDDQGLDDTPPLPDNMPPLLQEVENRIREQTQARTCMGPISNCRMIWFLVGFAIFWLGLIVVVILSMTIPAIYLPTPIIFVVVASCVGTCLLVGKVSPDEQVSLSEMDDYFQEKLRQSSGATYRIRRLKITAQCFHIEQRGRGNRIREATVTTHTEEDTFEFPYLSQEPVCSIDEIHSFPASRIQFMPLEAGGVAFGDEATRDAFVRKWCEVYHRNKERDEGVAMRCDFDQFKLDLPTRVEQKTGTYTTTSDSGVRTTHTYLKPPTTWDVIVDPNWSGLQWLSSRRLWLCGWTCCLPALVWWLFRDLGHCPVEYWAAIRLTPGVPPAPNAVFNPKAAPGGARQNAAEASASTAYDVEMAKRTVPPRPETNETSMQL